MSRGCLQRRDLEQIAVSFHLSLSLSLIHMYTWSWDSTMPGAPKCEPVFDLIAERVKQVGRTCRQFRLSVSSYLKVYLSLSYLLPLSSFPFLPLSTLLLSPIFSLLNLSPLSFPFLLPSSLLLSHSLSFLLAHLNLLPPSTRMVPT